MFLSSCHAAVVPGSAAEQVSFEIWGLAFVKPTATFSGSLSSGISLCNLLQPCMCPYTQLSLQAHPAI